MRQLVGKLTLRTPGQQAIRRAVLIEDAQHLSHESQNALLKVLEEPPADTVFVLTAPSDNDLLVTTVSRLQKLRVYPVSLAQAKTYYKDSFSAGDIQSAWSLSGGCAGLLDALLNDQKAHPLKSAVNDFKHLLGKDRYDRLAMLDKLDKNKSELGLLLDAGGRIMSVLHKDSIKKGNRAQAEKLLNSRKRLIEASARLKGNASPRLVILSLALSLEV